MAETVYILCALTSFVCAALLARSYFRVRTPLLLWSSLCFVGVAINNVLLVIDLILLPVTIDLMVYRTSTLLIGMMLLLYGLIWEKA